MPKHLTSAVKPLRTFLSFKDFNLLKSLAPSARSFFNFIAACYFQVSGPSCYISFEFLIKRLKYSVQIMSVIKKIWVKVTQVEWFNPIHEYL